MTKCLLSVNPSVLSHSSQLIKTHKEGREEKGEVMPKDMQV